MIDSVVGLRSNWWESSDQTAINSQAKTFYQPDPSITWLHDWMIAWLTDCMVDWLHDWMKSWLADWFIDEWLIKWWTSRVDRWLMIDPFND